MEDSNPELESFRKQWQEEVTRRANTTTTQSQSLPFLNNHSSGPSNSSQRPPRPKNIYENPKTTEEDAVVEPQSLHFDGPSGTTEGIGDDGIYSNGKSTGVKEPQSALEHYEKAVEKEGQGSLGDSLDLYRKAFRVCSVPIDRKTTKFLLTIKSLMIKLIANIRTNISHHLPFRRNLQIQTLPMLLPQYPIPHSTH